MVKICRFCKEKYIKKKKKMNDIEEQKLLY